MRVFVPSCTEITSVPINSIFWTFIACLATSTLHIKTFAVIPNLAATVAVETPCIHAHVSAIKNFLPILCASIACTIA
ncbi:hypothetical protein GW750_05965 [bacterium]|nr:hypothetical protein [bacterium]